MSEGEGSGMAADAFVRIEGGYLRALSVRDVLYALERLPGCGDAPPLLNGYSSVAGIHATDRGVYFWSADELKRLDQGKIMGCHDGLLREGGLVAIREALKSSPEWGSVYIAFEGYVDTVRLRKSEDSGVVAISFEADGTTYGCHEVVNLALIMAPIEAPPLPETVVLERDKVTALVVAIDTHQSAIAEGHHPQATWDAVLAARQSVGFS